ncbi:putative peroxisome biogenesis protein [Helianthus anomalus]
MLMGFSGCIYFVQDGEAYGYLLNVLAPEHSNPSPLVVWKIQATVKLSVLEVLIEITKYSYLYLMGRVLDNESHEKVLTALENAGVFTFGCLVKDKVITTRWLRMFLDRNS